MGALTVFVEHYNYVITIFLMMTGLYIVVARGNMVKKLVGLSILPGLYRDGMAVKSCVMFMEPLGAHPSSWWDRVGNACDGSQESAHSRRSPGPMHRPPATLVSTRWPRAGSA